MDGWGLVGTGVIAFLGTHEFEGGQVQGVFLTEYDQTTDSYVGVCFPHNPYFLQLLKAAGKGLFIEGAKVNVSLGVRVQGLRRYPYSLRPDYAFQFVLPGESPLPLIEIARGNVPHPATEPPSGGEVITDTNIRVQADTDQSGKVSGEEAKEWNKMHPDQPITKGKV
jgi:hypothetical protein